MRYYKINDKGQIEFDRFATWINNSKWRWLIPLICVLIGGLLDGIAMGI